MLAISGTRMRILQIHKFFHPHAGSETVLFHTRELLSARGHEIVDFAMEHPENIASPYSSYFAPHRDYVDGSRPLPSRAQDALASVYSFSARKRLRQLLEATRPDIAHMHIIYHQLTLSIVDELARQRVPMALTMHDYKIGCPAYVMYRDGHPCNLCTKGPVENAFLHRCIKGSRPASLLAAIEARVARQRHTYSKVDAHIAPSRFAAGVATETGVHPDTVHVVPNFLPMDEIGESVETFAPEPRFFFAGRLEEVKGIRELLDIYKTRDPSLGKLVLAGAGGDLEEAVISTASHSENIEYLGRLSRGEVREQLRRSRAILVPSLWFENNPMSLLEARAVGIPVIATNMGGLPEMVADGTDGFLVPRGDEKALAAAIRKLAQDQALAEKMGHHGKERLLRDNTPDVHYHKLMATYESAIARRASHA